MGLKRKKVALVCQRHFGNPKAQKIIAHVSNSPSYGPEMKKGGLGLPKALWQS
jgi:hypothetical protein